MIIVSIFGGLVSQIRAFYIGYKLGKHFDDIIALDISQFYNGYYHPYLMDLLDVPDCTRIAFRGTLEDRVKMIENLYKQEPRVIKNGEELEQVYNCYDAAKIYYLVNDCCYYDDFCYKHHEFFFRYMGSDPATTEIMNMMHMPQFSEYINKFETQIANCESVGIHIRLQDFVQIGWMVEQDYDFYRAAVQWFREKLEKPLFFVFSDDMETAKEILGVEDDIFYMENTHHAQNDVEQLLCLSKCRHRVLSKKSGFSLFAAVIAQNKWNQQGYTLIIKQMNLAENASQKEYVDNNFNKNPILEWEDNLCNCVLLNKSEIESFNKIYLHRRKGCFDKKDITTGLSEREKIEDKFIFLTLQTFSKTCITGMERMAKWLADNGNDVHFVGEQKSAENDKSRDFQWTLQSSRQAKDFKGTSLQYVLYPYAELNKNDNYIDFIHYLCNDREDNPAYIIVRKPQGLPPLDRHKKCNARFIFIDFTDTFEIENWRKLTEDDLLYLYENADMVITFNNTVYDQYRVINSRMVYVDLKKFYPDVKVWNKRLENINEVYCEDNLYQYIVSTIKRFFDDKG